MGEIDDILNNLKKALEGNYEFTLILTDPQGGSYIIPQNKSKYKFEKLGIEKSE